MSSTNPRPDNYWGSCSGFAGEPDTTIKEPPLWVLLVAAAVIVAGVFAYPLWRDESAPAGVVEVQP